MTLSRSEYARRAAITAGLALGAVALFFVLRTAAPVLLILFAGVLLAVFLHGAARWLSQRTPLRRPVALGAVLVVLVALIAGMGWFVGPRIAEQVPVLTEQLPQTAQNVQDWVEQYGWGQRVVEQMPESPGEVIPDLASTLSTITTAFSVVLSILANGFIIVFVGLYLAANPSLYVNAAVRLVPPQHRREADSVVATMGRALRYWLLGRIASMLVVGALTATGLFLFGVPLALTLGLIAALFSFVPYLGPILGLAPALAVALPEGQMLVVLGIYLAVQLLESYLVTPLIQERVISMPPALLITAQLLLGVLIGAVGVAVATPLTVVVIVLVQRLYVENTLGDDVEVMGEDE